MPLTFLIRDDDTNYFTKPEQLEECYSDVWDFCPISLSVVPFHGGTESGAIPKEYWSGNDMFPVGDNVYLVRFLREKIAEGKVYIMMHGYSHKDEQGGPEFVAGYNLDRKVAEGKRYLEQVFGVPIRVFVPPHNALSRQGFMAVVNNGLSISGIVGLRSRPFDLCAVRKMLVRRWWRFAHGGEYPFPIHYKTYTELAYYPLTPLVSLASLIRRLDYTRKWNGWFCLATHYWEFGARQRTGENATLGEVFRQFWNRVLRISDVRFVSLEAIL
jgi:hypothetical protein